MAGSKSKRLSERSAEAWALAGRQHGIVTRRDLLELGFSPKAIEHRVARGRLHPVARGVYAVGWPLLTRERRWMAAVLACGEGAALSHRSAAALWGFGEERAGRIDVSVRRRCEHRRPGIRARSRPGLPRGAGHGFEVDSWRGEMKGRGRKSPAAPLEGMVRGAVDFCPLPAG